MEKRTGYSTTTYKFRLDCSHGDWLWKTREIYNLVMGFYYEVLQKRPELAAMDSSQKIMRQLELLTIGARGQEKESLECPFPYGKVPLYFRRAAINDAIRICRIEKGREPQGNQQHTGQFQAWPIFYKGMYKDFTETGICLKLWNGEKWVWEECGLDTCGRDFPAESQLQSPTLKLSGKKAMLHVPVRKEVEDVRKAKERLFGEERICSAAFPSNDCMAVLTVLDLEGTCRETLFIRGGAQLKHEKKKLLNRICKNRISMGLDASQWSDGQGNPDENKHLKNKIRNLTDSYAHKVSRQIVDFCKARGIGVLVAPNYKQSLDLNRIGYLSATNYDWLGRRIIQYVKYKAFEEGIVVATVSTKGIAGTCYECGEPVKRYNKNNKPGKNYYGGKNYICPNGHKGNAFFNEAMNVGRRFLRETPLQD